MFGGRNTKGITVLFTIRSCVQRLTDLEKYKKLTKYRHYGYRYPKLPPRVLLHKLLLNTHVIQCPYIFSKSRLGAVISGDHYTAPDVYTKAIPGLKQEEMTF